MIAGQRLCDNSAGRSHHMKTGARQVCFLLATLLGAILVFPWILPWFSPAVVNVPAAAAAARPGSQPLPCTWPT